MKHLFLLLAFVLSSTILVAQAPTSGCGSVMPQPDLTPVSGCGSVIPQPEFPTEIEPIDPAIALAQRIEMAWDMLYSTLDAATLSAKFFRKVHRFYKNLKGFEFSELIWSEVKYVEELQYHQGDSIPVAPTVLAAWDSVYLNVPTEDLKELFRFRNHFEYTDTKNLKLGRVRDETQYINRIKEAVQQQ